MLIVIVDNRSSKFLSLRHINREKLRFLSCPAHTAVRAVPACTRMHHITNKTFLAGSPKLLSIMSKHFFYLKLHSFSITRGFFVLPEPENPLKTNMALAHLEGGGKGEV